MGAVYTQLSLQERRKIENWWHAKVPIREMAHVLKHHKSTIFREIKRNGFEDKELPELDGYYGVVAQREASKFRDILSRLVDHFQGTTPI